jgi:HlyD family type I secretion membrane fusion protein
MNMPNPLPETPGSDLLPNANYAGTIRFGLWVLVLGCGGFLAWAALAPLDEGVPAPGVLASESRRKHIDHLTGGIVAELLVREGSRVKMGENLLLLDDVQAGAALNAALGEWYIAAATAARLSAEKMRLGDITFPAELSVGSGEPQAAAAMAAQEDLFRSRQTALEGELDIIRRSVRGLELQIRSLDQLKVGREKQIALFEERLAAYTMLQEEGWATRSQLIDIEGQLAEVQSKQSEDLANIAGIQAQLSEFRMRGVQRENEFRREVETQIAGVQQDVSTLAERIVALRDTHQRLAVKSPVDGVVVDVAFHTIGGIIKPGDRILDIVPEGDALTVEAQVAPHYIDRVHAGLEADVHFDAYMARAEQPVITGSVTVVSADALTNARTGEQYYSIRVSVSPAELEKLGSLTLQPGMTGTVMVKTGERSLLIYLMRPFLRRFSSALSEP